MLVVALCKVCVFDRWLAGIAVSYPSGARTCVSCERCVLSGRGLCIGLITSAAE